MRSTSRDSARSALDEAASSRFRSRETAARSCSASRRRRCTQIADFSSCDSQGYTRSILHRISPLRSRAGQARVLAPRSSTFTASLASTPGHTSSTGDADESGNLGIRVVRAVRFSGAASRAGARRISLRNATRQERCRRPRALIAMCPPIVSRRQCLSLVATHPPKVILTTYSPTTLARKATATGTEPPRSRRLR
jgi:hypothetical protein